VEESARQSTVGAHVEIAVADHERQLVRRPLGQIELVLAFVTVVAVMVNQRDVGIARDEVPVSADNLRFFAGAARTLEGRAAGEYMRGYTSMIRREPVGIVGQISPWNYPFTLALCDGLPALLAGNAVVIKPDSQTVLTALLGAELLEQAGFPRELWQVVAGPGREIGTPLIQGVDYMCFTGSTATGKLIAQQCAERVIGCSLELGGKNPILILRDVFDGFSRFDELERNLGISPSMRGCGQSVPQSTRSGNASTRRRANGTTSR